MLKVRGRTTLAGAGVDGVAGGSSVVMVGGRVRGVGGKEREERG